jgi:hypothetical protein
LRRQEFLIWVAAAPATAHLVAKPGRSGAVRARDLLVRVQITQRIRGAYPTAPPAFLEESGGLAAPRTADGGSDAGPGP